MKRKLSLLLIYVVVALTVAGVVFSTILLTEPNLDLEIRVNANGETQETLNINASGIYPGEERKYSIKLLNADKGCYKTTFSFVETDAGSLSDYIIVAIVMQEQTKTNTLSQLLAGEKIEFVGSGKFINILYRMPTEAGNDAQGAKVSFQIKLNIRAEGK